MLCELCHKNRVSFVISMSTGSEIKSRLLCEDCATNNAKSIAQSSQPIVTAAKSCRNCGTRWKASLFGCPDCYSEFHNELIPILRRIHGDTKHKGKAVSKKTQGLDIHKAEDNIFSGIYNIPASNSQAKWMLGNGPDFDVVISTRIRLARNLKGHLFCHKANDSELYDIASIVEGAIGNIKTCNYIRNACIINLEALDDIDREFLVERHLISRDLAEKRKARRVIISEKETTSIMLNEEDHIRLQVIDSGLQVRQLWEMVNEIDNELGKSVEYAFSPEFGYLTACPTNTGTGLRVSVMFHLPALASTRGGNRKLSFISDMGFAIRGIYGEGSKATGAFYQISNEATLGQSEEDIINSIQSIALQIIDLERNARRTLIEKNKVNLEDRIFRSYGILANSRVISSEEAIELLSWVNLGVNLGIISNIDKSRIAQLLFFTQPAHLQKLEGKAASPLTRDIKRAAIVRAVLNNTSN